MSRRRALPVALTIAGSDSGGGAGIQADLKTFAALGVHGTSAITCLTAQNPTGVRGIQAARPALVRQQIAAVCEALPPAAAKTGMLFSTAIIRAVAAACREFRLRVVVDPVMVATSGARLLQPAAIHALTDRLLPLATLLTPNLDEAELLLGRRLRHPDDLRSAARELHRRFGVPALVKGGHLRALRAAVDFYFDGRSELLLEAPFVPDVSTHGTGCTYSAAIVAHLALGRGLPEAVARAKQFITAAIAGSRPCGHHQVLGFFPGR